jgi:predicted permease
MNPTALASTILTFVAIVGVGAALRAAGVLKREHAHPINAVIIYAGLPAFIFRAVHSADLRPDLIGVVAVAWLVFGATALLGWLVARLFHLPAEKTGAFVLVAALGNTGYVGYPVTQAFLGAKALPEAIFYDVFGTVFALALVGIVIAERFGSSEAARAHPLRELLSFPAVPALIIALALKPITIPIPVMDGLGLLANMVAPLIMISVGLSLRASTLGSNVRELGAVAGVRLLAAPVLGLALGTVLVGHSLALQTTTLEAGMPAMMLTYVIAERFGLDTDFVASAIFVTTALSVLTLPALQLVAFR